MRMKMVCHCRNMALNQLQFAFPKVLRIGKAEKQTKYCRSLSVIQIRVAKVELPSLVATYSKIES